MHPVEGSGRARSAQGAGRNPDLIQRPEGGRPFELVSEFQPAGDQPQAIAELVDGPAAAASATRCCWASPARARPSPWRMSSPQMQRPAIVLAPNKILAAQLYGEFKSFFPNNSVEYFVSYYDYYQPEAYVPRTDTYIEKTSSINEQIDRMRHSATRALFERDDVIIVASVSCIYGIGSPETYARMTLTLKQGQQVERQRLLRALVELQYRRNELDFTRGAFRAKGDTIEIFPAHLEDRAWRLSMFGDEVESITEFDPLTGERSGRLDQIRLYPNSHYVTPKPTLQEAVEAHQGGAEGAARVLPRHRQAARGRADRAAHGGRPRDDHDHRLLPGDRELFALPHRPRARRAAADPVRVHPRERDPVRRREPRRGAAGRRHVQGRLPAQEHAGRVRLPPAVLHRQPPAQVRGVGRDAAADDLRLGHARRPGSWSAPAACSSSR